MAQQCLINLSQEELELYRGWKIATDFTSTFVEVVHPETLETWTKNYFPVGGEDSDWFFEDDDKAIAATKALIDKAMVSNFPPNQLSLSFGGVEGE